MTIATQTVGRQWLIPSESEPNTLHIVKRVACGFSCTCPDYFHRRSHRGETCKHIRGVEAQELARMAPVVSLVSPEAQSWARSILTGGRQA